MRVAVVGNDIAGSAAAYFLKHGARNGAGAARDVNVTLLKVRGLDNNSLGVHDSILTNRKGRELLGLVKRLGLGDAVEIAELANTANKYMRLSS